MRASNLLLTVFLFMTMSCEHEEAQPSVLTKLTSKNGVSYEQSLSSWNELKNANGNSYAYQIAFTSWTGHGSTTELKIEDGVITSRIYEAFSINESGEKEITGSYEEHGGNLGTHENGSPLMTIDDLYQSCAKDYLIVDAGRNKIYFETGEGDLMTLCGFVPEGCEDDCYSGIRINAFNWL